MIEKDSLNVKTSVSRKKHNTEQYISYSSHHHSRIFTGIIKCLQHSAREWFTLDNLPLQCYYLKVFLSHFFCTFLTSGILHVFFVVFSVSCLILKKMMKILRDRNVLKNCISTFTTKSKKLQIEYIST